MDNKPTTIRFSIGTKAFAQGILEPTTAKEFQIKGMGRGSWMHLTDLYTHPFIRGRGYARLIMDAVCKHADRHHLNLVLTVLPHGEGSIPASALEFFYGQFGFECHQRHMIRSYINGA